MNHSIKRMGARVILVCLTLFVSSKLQSATVSGTVRDSLTQETLSDVHITIQGSTNAAYTDELGQFRLTELQAGTAVLRFSRLGYVSQTLTLNVSETNTEYLNISLVKGSIRLTEVPINSTKDIGQPMSTINKVDMALRPTNSAQDLLRLVPGLFIAQHAGGGKAEQIFLRGFDVDHGTDFAVAIDGIPVNMVSHAHGQGYADFHFVIPETVEKLSVNKGLYSARQGDFATAGSADFFTKNAIEKNMIKLEYGRFETYRVVGMFKPSRKKLLTGNNENAYVAGEYNYTNSYFERSQHFQRYNVFGKYSTGLGLRSNLSLSVSTFKSSWDASGQVPDRAVLAETITRFGSIDPTEGGETSRTNANVILISGTQNGGVFKNQIFYSFCKFDLFSNFTFFLNDSINGDQIRQTEKGRSIYGYSGTYDKSLYIGASQLRTVFGIGTRIDNGEIALMNSTRRVVRDTIAAGKLNQQNLHAYVDETITLNQYFSINAGARLDYFIFGYSNYLDDSLSGKKSKPRISPKLSVYYTPNSNLQFYAKSGIGFHSNDARSVVSGEAGNSVPRAYGYETGSTFKLAKKLLVNFSLWGLDLENELIYVGDAGIVEVSGATRRLGVDFAMRLEITKNIFADADFNYNHGRYLDLPDGENFIPLAPSFTSTGGVSIKNKEGLSASLRYRFIDSRPANENNTVQAKGYFLLDAVVYYQVNRFTFGLTGENLLNAEWNEAQFDTESKLIGEALPVSELHYTPGAPFFIRGSVSVAF